MRRAVLLLLLAAGCQRDLTIPPASNLAFLERSPVAAPLETLDLAVDGGARPYGCELALDVSGATVTALPQGCRYTAGAAGPASDLVRVTDAQHAAIETRVAVGPPLSVLPRSVFLGPGGRASFVPGGGKGPYTMEIVEGAGSVDGTDYLAPPSGGCTGTISPPTQARLLLHDSTAAAPIALSVSVGRGLDLFPAAGTGVVAPHEQLAFVASGGQPPYEFSLQQPSPSGSPGVDAGRGTYRAGPQGGVVDRVQVADANGEVRCFDVSVGPPLTVSFSSDDPRPGQPLRLEASGGRAPYRFEFAPKGNRSRGQLDPVSGSYTPGLNALATDRLQVSDATGAARVGPLDVQVGPTQLATDAAFSACDGADVNGDGVDDLVWSALSFTTGLYDVGLAISVPGSSPLLRSYATGGLAPPLITDIDGDGLADVVYVADDGLRTLLGSRDGSFVEGPHLGIFVRGLAFAMARGDPRVIFATADPSCGGGVRLATTSIDPTTGEFRPPSCLVDLSVLPRVLIAGDFNGDGRTDVAFATAVDPGALHYRLAQSTGFAAETSVALRPPWRLEAPSSLAPRFAREVRQEGGPRSDVVAIALDAPRASGTFNTGLASFAGGPGGLTLRVLDEVLFEDTYNLLGLNLLGTAPGRQLRVAAWDGTDGASALYDQPFVAGAGEPSVELAPRRYRVGCVAGGDFDGDGIEDVAILPRDQGGRADVLHGEGDGTFGRRPRFSARGSPYPTGDVDGDGISDFIVPTAGTSFEVLLADGGEIAVGPETPVPGQFSAAGAGDFDGDGVADVIARVGAEGMWFFRGRLPADGHFDPGVRLVTTDAAGQPFSTSMVTLMRANLGGASPGPDFLSLVRLGSRILLATILVEDAGHATVGLANDGPSITYVASGDADGDGTDDVLVSDPNSIAYLTLVKPGDARGTSWPFRDLVVATRNAVLIPSGTLPVPGTTRRRFVVLGDGITLVDAPDGMVEATPVPVTAPPAGGDLYDAVIADVDADGAADLVVRDSHERFELYRGTAAGELSGDPELLELPAGLSVALFSFLEGAGPPDMLLQLARGDWMVLHNDGTGHFR
jgi:hypothetical protein